MNDRIVWRKGWISVATPFYLSTPEIRTLYFRAQGGEMTEADAETRGILGLEAKRIAPGQYEIRPSDWARLIITLVDGPCHDSEITAVPCPKVRAGVETRWNDSYSPWEKYLKTKGWVPA